MAGYAVRLVLMRQRGSLPGDILAASLLYSSLSNLVLLTLLPVGLGYLLVDHPLSGVATTALVLAIDTKPMASSVRLGTEMPTVSPIRANAPLNAV
jgi:hypothetical protein